MRKSKIPYLTEAELIPSFTIICDALRKLHKIGFVHGRVMARSMLLHADMRKGHARVVINPIFCLLKNDIDQLHNGMQKSVKKAYLQSLYLAPEVLQGYALSPLSDIWSLGVTLYTLACGKFPFKNQSMILEGQLEFP